VTFILSAQRDVDARSATASFARYHEYVAMHRDAFPPGVRGLATSEWYFDSRDHRCPHDSRLLMFGLTEQPHGRQQPNRPPSLRIELEGAYADGHIVLTYPEVFRYECNGGIVGRGHCDWRYDEFRIASHGRLEHEIEWWSMSETARWLIEASDVIFEWAPRQ